MKNFVISLTVSVLFSFWGFGQNFITTWVTPWVSDPISFSVETTGPVNYTWQSTTTSASGSGSFLGPNAVIGSLPFFDTIQLSIEPQNLQRFINSSSSNCELLQVNQWGAVEWTSMEDAFGLIGFFININGNLQITATDTPNLTNCTSLKNMFRGCGNLNSFPMNANAWDISTITDLSGMFLGTSFNQALNSWNTSNVTDMSRMFENNSQFNQNIGSWNTSNVTNMSKMFKNARNFDRNIGTWNTSNVTDMSEMFFSTLLTVNDMQFNKNIGYWNTSSVTNMSGMFHGAVNFNQNIGNWNTSNVNLI